MPDPVLLWLRQDLRLADQPALLAALEEGPVVPVYILDDEAPGEWRIGGAQRWWLHYSLAALDEDLRARGSRLILRRGGCAEVLPALAREVGAGRVHALAHAEPWWRAAEAAVADRLDLVLHDGAYLAPLGAVTTGSGQGFKIYSPFWRALAAKMPPPGPLAAPDCLAAPRRWPASDRLADWALLPTHPDWATGFAPEWKPGEAGAHAALEDFALHAADYAERRNLPSERGSSRLSPHLHFGELSPAHAWHGVADRGGSVDKLLGELGWRDFTANLTLAYPDYAERPVKPRFERLAFRHAPAELRAWQRGRTGYPIVDAGMRQLWTTGWMHNRVRMIAASFLVKHLLIDWREGERWFWDTLVDADYGNNAVNWQWIAGSGIDASIWSRIMAPLAQSIKFEAADYIRRWVPELAHLPDEAVHDPDETGRRPADYPAKIIGHREARERALAAGRALR
jgi:deoxyribodipyrimidine photo-lyase